MTLLSWNGVEEVEYEARETVWKKDGKLREAVGGRVEVGNR
jgi:hypothetical protein